MSESSTVSAGPATDLSPKFGRPPRLDHGLLRRLAGTMPDVALARRLGCTPSWVVRWRQAAGVARFDPLREYLDALGYYPDTEVARMAGVHPCTVARRRRQLGIEFAGNLTRMR